MKCHICDAELNEKEIVYNDQLKAFEPCGTCLEIAFEAAFAGGVPGDDTTVTAVDSDFDDQGNEWWLFGGSTYGREDN